MVERIRTLLESRQLTPTQFADAIGVARPIVSHILSGRNKPSLEVVQRILAALPDLSMAWLLNGNGPMLAANIGLPAMPAPAPAPEAASPALPINLAPEQVAEADDQAKYSASQLPDNKLSTPLVAGAPASGPSASARNPPSAPAATAPAPVPTVASASIPLPTAATPAPVAQPLVRPAIRRFAAPSLANKELVDSVIIAKATPPAIIAAPVVPQPPTPEAKVTSPAGSAEAPPVAIEQHLPHAPAPSATAAALFAGSEKPIRRIVIFYRDGSFADYQPE